jgi:AcrR family transcriptional regulator
MPVAPVTSAAPDDTSPGESVEAPSHEAEQAVIQAARGCLHTIGRDKVTMDDVCAAAGISRATLYRIFPGGRDVLFDAVRRHSIEEFFADIRTELEGASSLEDFLVRVIVAASRALREDTELAALLATQPGVALGDLTLDGLDRIIGVATGFITPFTDEFIPASEAAEIVDIVVRLTISHYLSPSQLFDLTDKKSVTRLVRAHLLPSGHGTR